VFGRDSLVASEAVLHVFPPNMSKTRCFSRGAMEMTPRPCSLVL
jgi:hypothetical protein